MRIIAITGAARGIGEATARHFAAEGSRCILLDIDPAAEQTAASLEPQGLYLPCDVSSRASVEAAFAEIRARFGGLDVLVNNAGIEIQGTATELAEEDWDRILDVNLKGAWLCCRSAIPLMEGRAHPVVVNVSSVQAFVVQRRVTAYAASKAGMNSLTRSIAADYAPWLRAVSVCPGAVDTPLLRGNLAGFPPEQREAMLRDTEGIHLLKRLSQPAEVAAFIGFLASPAAGFCTGQAYRVDGGIGVLLEGT